MTIIATYSLGDKAVYVSDFRVGLTFPDEEKEQHDIVMKFIQVGSDMGLYVAGDLDYWIAVGEEFENNRYDPNRENVSDSGSEFLDTLKQVRRQKKYGYSCALAFVLDRECHKNNQYLITVINEKNIEIDKIDADECFVIGSGRVIPNIKERIETASKISLRHYPDDLFRVGVTIKSEVFSALKNAGSASFEKLGISPLLSIGILDKDCFHIIGEEIITKNITTRSRKSFKVSFTLSPTGQMLLRNELTDEEHEVNMVLKSSNIYSGGIFDPTSAQAGADPSLLYPESNFIYYLHQWCIHDNDIHPLYSIFRSFDRIDFVGSHRLCKYTRIHRFVLEDITEEEYIRYVKISDVYFPFDKSKQKEFEKFIIRDELFNHDELEKYIEGYSNKLYSKN